MQLNGGDPTDITCNANEAINISITEQNTARVIAKTLDGLPLSSDSFAAGGPGSTRSLIIALGFSGNQGNGQYDVTLTGSGPDVSFLPVTEPPAPKVRNVSYTISVA